MKFQFLTLLLSLFANVSNATNLHIDHPCSVTPILEVSKSIDSSADSISENIFSFTKKHILENNIKADLASDGIVSILNYVSADKSIEVISDTKMRAYGWCYSINNEVPDVMPNQVKLADSDLVKWYLSYSTYDSGNWVDYCVPVKSNPEAAHFICH